MAGRQTIVENGRVSALFKIMSTVVAVLIASGILGIFHAIKDLQVDINDLTLELAEKKTEDAIQNLNYEYVINDHARFERRLDALERKRGSERDNSREQ